MVASNSLLHVIMCTLHDAYGEVNFYAWFDFQSLTRALVWYRSRAVSLVAPSLGGGGGGGRRGIFSDFFSPVRLIYVTVVCGF